MNIKVKKLNENAILPTYGSASAAGADISCLPGEDIVIPPHETVMVHTGLAMELPEGYAGFLFARSGIASKRGLAPANKVGVVDSDYRGEFMVALHNHSSVAATIAGGERIAQLEGRLKAETEARATLEVELEARRSQQGIAAAEEAKKAALPDLEIEPQAEENVDFDTFCKSDFRAVKVKACENVKKSNKLLKFTLDDGTGVDRQILSGIAMWYKPCGTSLRSWWVRP